MDQIERISRSIAEGNEVPTATTRELLRWFGAQRRGHWVVNQIREGLDKANLCTDPDFESAWIDANLQFRVKNEPTSSSCDDEVDSMPLPEQSDVAGDTLDWISKDPTYRISKLAAANQRVLSVSPDATVAEVVTLLMARDFSQMPVMTSERDVKGVVSWRSIATRLALGNTGKFAKDFMESHQEVRHSVSIFDAIPSIMANDHVLVRAADQRISGIVTSSDLSQQFRNLSEPFLLISEIENLVRNMIGEKFLLAELKAAIDPAENREVLSANDLTFGEYIRLLQNEARWAKLENKIDRKIFCADLDAVRSIRNDVTHFDPDGVTPQDIDRLRDFKAFLQQLAAASG